MNKHSIPILTLLCLATAVVSKAGIVLNGSNANLVIESGATVVTDGMINGGVITNNGVIDNNGDWANTGTAAVDNLVMFTGTSAQSISGTTDFQTVHLDNATGASLASGADVSIYNVLELKTGTFTTTGGTLTFISTSVTHCAIIDNFSSGFSGTMSGPVTAQRYHNAASGTFDQHLMGSPLSGVAYSDFVAVSGTNGQPVTPTPDCDETQLDPSSNYGSIFEWDESIVSSCVLEGWIVRSAGNTSNGKGYGVASPGVATLDVTGTPNLSPSYSQSNLNNSSWNYASLQGTPYGSGWHLLSNPYLASFDLNGSANSAFDNGVQIMHTHGSFAGTYQPLLMNTAAVLAPFQAFMVRKTNSGAGTFNFNGSDRSLGAATFQKVEALEGSMEILVEGNTFADITYLQFDPQSTTGYDPQFDAYKFLSSPGRPTLFTKIGNEWMSINVNPSPAEAPVVPMGFRPGANGTFTFNAQNMNLPTGITVVLEDIQLNVFQDLSNNPTYTFSSTTADNEDRFNVHFSSITDVEDVEDVIVEDVRTWSDGSSVFVQPLNLQEQAIVNVFDATGRLLHTSNVQPNVQKTIDLQGASAGVVIVQVTTSNAAFTQKVIINR